MSELNNVLNEILVDKDTNLLPENLKAGVTCLGVEGTYEGGSSSDVPVKLFETEDQMQSDETAQEGDKAVIYREQIQSTTQDTEFQVCEFPTTVTLDTAFTDNVYGVFRSVDSEWFDANAELSQTQFRFNWYGGGSYGEVTYTSEDGITYTRTDTLGNPIDLGTIIKSEYGWNNLFGKFIFALGHYFGGLFNYKIDVTETSIYKNANYLDDTAKFYKIPKVVSDLFKTGNSLVIPTVVSPNRDYFDVVSGTLYTSTMAGYRLVEQPSRTLLAFNDYGISNDESVAFEKIDFDLSLDNPIVAKTNITLADIKTYPYQFKLTGLNGNWYSNIILTDQILVNIDLSIGTSVLTTDDPKPSGTVGTTGTYYNAANLVHNVYVYANTQLSKIKENQLFEDLTVYGQDGIVTGDGSIYNNLGNKLLFDALGINYEEYAAPGFDVTDKNIRSLILDNTSNILLPFYNYDNQIATNNTGIVNIYNNDISLDMIETQDYIVIYYPGSRVKVDVYSKIDMTLKRSFTIPDMYSYYQTYTKLSFIQNGSKLYSMYACSNGDGNIVMKGIVLDVDTGEQHVYSKTTTSGTTNSNTYRMCVSVTGFVLKGAIGTALSLYLDSSKKPQPMVTTVDFESGTMTIDKKSTSSIVLSGGSYLYNSIVVNDCIYVGTGHNTNLDAVLFRYDVVNNTISSYVLPEICNSIHHYCYFVLDENNKWLIPQGTYETALSKKALNYETLTVVDIPTDYIMPKMSESDLSEPTHIVNDVILPIYTMPRWPIGATSLKYGLLTMSTDDDYTVFIYTKDNCILYSKPNNRFIITPYTLQKCSVVEGLVDKTLESYIKMNDGRDYLLLNTTFN